MAEATGYQRHVKEISILEDSVNAVIDQCDSTMRETLLSLVQETKQRQAGIERTLGDAKNALDDMRLATKSLIFSEEANLQDTQKAVRMIENIESKLDDV